MQNFGLCNAAVCTSSRVIIVSSEGMAALWVTDVHWKCGECGRTESSTLLCGLHQTTNRIPTFLRIHPVHQKWCYLDQQVMDIDVTEVYKVPSIDMNEAFDDETRYIVPAVVSAIPPIVA